MPIFPMLLSELRQLLPHTVQDLPEAELRVFIENLLARFRVVSRDEFDAQRAVLLRTREKLEQRG